MNNTSSSEINQSLQEDLNIAGDIIFRPNRKREIDRGEPWEGGIIPFVFVRGAFDMSSAERLLIMDNATILHELYHVLGFEHEHCRYDRYKYVTIYENILPADDDVLKVPYDYESIFHNPEYAFSKNGNLMIITKVRTIKTIIFLAMKRKLEY
ncbi:hypothetical protein Avbf_11609 [Armadillidium vulgare]|nr:hypothetical protein Avbf_11609 [Armadillidium vulgare]